MEPNECGPVRRLGGRTADVRLWVGWSRRVDGVWVLVYVEVVVYRS